MLDMQVEFSFKKMARLRETVRMLLKGQVHTFLTEGNILSIWRQYSEQKRKEQSVLK
jgi:hypothetical protein